MNNRHICIVAEISANHNQKYEVAEALVYEAKRVGADAVKLQTYTPDTMTIKCNKPEFIVTGGTLWDGINLYDLYSKAYMPWEWQPKLKKLADEIGIDLFSTPYEETAVDFLELMGVSRYKVASYELVDLPLIKYIASKKKPMVISTGMASLSEIKEAVYTARDAGASDITLLKCTSAYPASPEGMNLLSIPYLKLQFALLPSVKVSVGLSDHTLELSVPVVAVALGACMVEKHITLKREGAEIDGSFSLIPSEFKEMVDTVRITERALGGKQIGVIDQEKGSLKYRCSLFVVEDVKKGDEFTGDNVRSIRPGYGLLPSHITEVLGKKSSRDIERGTPLQWDLVA